MIADLPYYRLPELLTITQLSESTIRLLEKSGSFPKRVKIGKRAVAWMKSDVENWIVSRK